MAKRVVTHDLSTPRERLRAWLHFYLKDHHLLRDLWWNLDEIGDGVWRSNQPSPRRLKHYKARGIHSVVSLRGGQPQSFNLLEREACARLGLTFHQFPGAAARNLAHASVYLDLVDQLAAVERPFVMHCKSGADRTGMAAALFLILIEGRDVAQVWAEQLRAGRIHFRRSKAGVLSHVFRVYLRDAAPGGLGFRAWLETGYDPEAITADFKDWRASRGRWAK